MTNNIIFSKNLFWVSWFFGNEFEKEKKPKIQLGLIFSQLVVDFQFQII